MRSIFHPEVDCSRCVQARRRYSCDQGKTAGARIAAAGFSPARSRAALLDGAKPAFVGRPVAPGGSPDIYGLLLGELPATGGAPLDAFPVAPLVRILSGVSDGRNAAPKPAAVPAVVSLPQVLSTADGVTSQRAVSPFAFVASALLPTPPAALTPAALGQQPITQVFQSEVPGCVPAVQGGPGDASGGSPILTKQPPAPPKAFRDQLMRLSVSKRVPE